MLVTTVVGSYPQPDWLIDRAHLGVPRVRAPKLWRVADSVLETAQDDATVLAIRDMERAGIDVITDGEIRRESYSNRFATALDGIDHEHPGSTIGRTGTANVVPRVVGPIRRRHAVEVRDVEFLRANTDRTIKITIPGPFTLAQQAQDDYYKDEEALALDYAVAVNEEARELKKAGADIIQLDEPWLQARPDRAHRYGVKAINRALEGIAGPTAIHLCFGYANAVRDKPNAYAFLAPLADSAIDQISIEAAQPKLDLGQLKDIAGKTVVIGVLDLSAPTVETPEIVAGRIRQALAHVAPERLVPAPDCGMKYMPRAVAFAKLKALADGAAIVRRTLG
ncbi:MAG TPA: uroporphyrinogen decarboxylase family protein [Stellaceae bacterium]|nr:uroporphyrinogen decarboxylase family protein [Stellaceae bacterium]